MFTGTYTAIVTPFRDGRLDEDALRRVIEMQIKGGVDGIVPVGTTGESPTLDYDEHLRMVELAKKLAGNKLRVIAGTGANSTREAVYLTQEAARLGVDATLQVAPYYNKPSQEGLYQHFRVIAAATRLPVLLYSIPGRCGVEIGVETVRRLAADCPTIVGIKEAGGNADRVSQLRAACGRKFSILCGDDTLTLPFMSVGAVGVISVASNILPREVSRMVRAYAGGQVRLAARVHEQLYPLFKDLFLDTNPVPVKAALAMMGIVAEEYRLPLCPMSAANREVLAKTLRACGALQATNRRTSRPPGKSARTRVPHDPPTPHQREEAEPRRRRSTHRKRTP